MKYLMIAILATLFSSCANNSHISGSKSSWPSNVNPPRADQIEKEFTLHDQKRIDEYYWLNQRTDTKVLDYLKAENAYLDTMMSSTKPLQEKLFTEMKARIKEKDETLPYKNNGYWYYSKYEEGKEYPVYCRKKENLTATEEIILDQNEMAKGFRYYAVGGRQVSDNNQLLAFTVDTVSRRLYGLRFKDLTSGKIYAETIPNIDGGALAWAVDNKTIFYIKKDLTTLLGFQVWRHELGSDIAKDVMVFEEKDNRYSLRLYRSKSRKYVVIFSDMNELSTEARLLEASDPQGSFKIFHPRESKLQYQVEHVDNKFFIRTDLDAPNFRIMETPEPATGKENWKELIPHRDDVLIAGMSIFTNHLVLNEVKDALSQLRIINLSDQSDHYITFAEPVYTTFVNINPDFNTRVLRFSYTSMTTPSSIYDYNMDTKEKKLMKQTEVLGGFNKEDYQSERIWATARDGARIPVSLLYKKGLRKDGKNPLLIYAYGSYGYSSFPSFNSNIISLINRGFIFAVAHVRGGQELGRKWYDGGRLLNKKNTFFDFIDCGEFLIQQQFSSKNHLYASGGSAGGLLMGAIVNYRPDLWNGVVAEVPFVDVITTMSDPSIPLTTGEYEEWGDPSVKEEYLYMKSYSPYDNVERKNYPNMLVTTGLHDSQVQYFEPAKWVARLREKKTDTNLLLFKINMDFGHGGASGRFDYLKDEALQYAFLLALEGVRE